MANLFRFAVVFVGLMLSFALSHVLSEKKAIDSAVAREASALRDTFINLGYFNTEEAFEARAKLVEYLESVVQDEWSHLEMDQLSQRTEEVAKEVT